MGVFDEEELFKYSEQEAARQSLDESMLSPRERLLKQLEKDISESEKTEKESFQSALDSINKTTAKLLAGPSKRETFQQVVSKLSQPKQTDDPRFYERRNLYTFLRDIGEVGKEQDVAKEKAQEEALKLQELANKYKLERAQAQGNRARQLAAQYLMREPVERPQQTSEFERLIAGLPPEEQDRMRRKRVESMVRPPRAEGVRAEKPDQLAQDYEVVGNPDRYTPAQVQAAKARIEKFKPADVRKAEIAKDKKAISILEDLRQKTRFAIPDINFAIDQVDKGGRQAAGLIASMIKGIPVIGQPATDLEKTIVSLQATLGFDKLKEFKEMSPTGASGLGAVSNAENRLLQSVQGSLEIDQSPANLKRNLNRLKNFYEKDVDETLSSLGISFDDIEAMPQEQSSTAPAAGESPAEKALRELERRRKGGR
jgi:hypothetical protein